MEKGERFETALRQWERLREPLKWLSLILAVILAIQPVLGGLFLLIGGLIQGSFVLDRFILLFLYHCLLVGVVLFQYHLLKTRRHLGIVVALIGFVWLLYDLRDGKSLLFLVYHLLYIKFFDQPG